MQPSEMYPRIPGNGSWSPLGSAKHTLGNSDIDHTVSIATRFRREMKYRSFRVVTRDCRFLHLRHYKRVSIQKSPFIVDSISPNHPSPLQKYN